jgi:hypothetical protein
MAPEKKFLNQRYLDKGIQWSLMNHEISLRLKSAAIER